MVTNLKMSENEMDYHGSKSIILNSILVCLLIFVALFLNLFNIFLFKVLYFNFIYFLSTYDLLVDVRYSRVTRFQGKCLIYNSGSSKSFISKGFRNYSTNSSSVAPLLQPVKRYINADLDKIRILEENKGKCGIYR
jgi:hypothetical protein